MKNRLTSAEVDTIDYDMVVIKWLYKNKDHNESIRNKIRGDRLLAFLVDRQFFFSFEFSFSISGRTNICKYVY